MIRIDINITGSVPMKKWFRNVTRRIFHELKKEKKHIEYAKYNTFAYVFLIWLHFGAVFTTGS